MGRDELKACIEKIREYNGLSRYNEDQAKKSIIEPICECLDWDIHNPNEFMVEYDIKSGGKVDYAFRKNDENVILLEAKRPKESLKKHSDQLLKYAFGDIAPLAILTNGIEWWFYLPREAFNWKERKFCSIYINGQDIDSVCDRFSEFLGKENVISGSAVDSAKVILKSREAKKKIKATLPIVWEEIINEPSERHVELLIEKTEKECGLKPSEQQATDYIAKVKQQAELQYSTAVSSSSIKTQQGVSLSGLSCWEGEASPEAIAITGELFNMIRVFATDCKLNDKNKEQIGIKEDGCINDFVFIEPKKKNPYIRMLIKLPENDKFTPLLKAQGVTVLKRNPKGQRKICLYEKDINNNRELISKMLKEAYEKNRKSQEANRE